MSPTSLHNTLPYNYLTVSAFPSGKYATGALTTFSPTKPLATLHPIKASIWLHFVRSASSPTISAPHLHSTRTIQMPLFCALSSLALLILRLRASISRIKSLLSQSLAQWSSIRRLGRSSISTRKMEGCLCTLARRSSMPRPFPVTRPI
jgi:hypothetical protein